MTASTWAHRAVVVALVLGNFIQRPGRTTFDTKLDLAEDPGGFLDRALHMWNPEAAFGEVQNQAYGYFFPQGLFFLLGDLAGLPAWIVQRAWTALLLVLAYEGVRRLARVLTPGASAATHVIAGLAYALGPRLLGVSATISGEALPTVFLPWMLLPLLLCRRGHLTPRTAALLSGCALLCISGMNAAGVIAVLPLPAMVLASGLAVRSGRRLAAWWCLAAVLACAWWLVPLLLLGRYSPPFLDYIETSSATTQPLNWFNALRGADHWVGYTAVGGEPWWPASYLLSTSTAGLVVTGLVVAVGVWGLARRGLLMRGIWVGSFLLGLACLVAGHAGELAGPLAEQVRAVLNGPLAPLRNVHKVDPLVRLPVALGVAHAGQLILAAWTRPRWTWRPVAVVVIGLLVAAGGFPIITGDLRKPGWSEIPESWVETAEQAARVQGEGRVLVLPGASSAEQVWGGTVDEPLQVLAGGPWAVRNQIPLAPGPTIRLLDSIEDLISSGRGSSGLAPLLARSGVSTVVLRHDLRPAATDAPPLPRVAQALETSPGISRVGTHGAVDGGPATEVFVVEGVVDRVAAVARADVVSMAGGPEDLLPALEAGVLQEDTPVVFGDAPEVQGDGYRLVERLYGRVHDARTAVRSPDDPIRSANRAVDYAAVPGQEPVVREHVDIASMAASSSAAFVDSFGGAVPAQGPYAAVDGDPATAWRSEAYATTDSEWLEVGLRRPTPVAGITVSTRASGATEVGAVTVDTGRQRRRVRIPAGEESVEVALNRSSVTKIRIRLERRSGEGGAVAVSEIAFPGLRSEQTLRLPERGATGDTAVVLTTAPPRRPCLATGAGAWCDPQLASPAQEPLGLDRTVTLASSGTFELSGTVVPLAAPQTLRLLEPLNDDYVRVRADSTFADDPLVAPQRALDGRPETGWLARPGEDSAQLRLRWGSPRRLDRLRVTSTLGGRTPTRAVITAGGERRVVELAGGLGFFEPLRTDRVRITLSAPAGVDQRPLGIGELVMEPLDDLRWDPGARESTGTVCGYGPPIEVDGTRLNTRVVGEFGDLRGLSMRLEPCGDAADELELSAGEHRVRVEPTGQFAPAALTLDPVDRPAPLPVERETQVESWDVARRTVRIGPGEESILRVAENTNPGWRATLDGETLRTVAVDGWQQGYVVPAGAGGVVRMEFVPDRTYRASMLGGGALALLLVLATLVCLRRDRFRGEGPWPRTGGVRATGASRRGWLARAGVGWWVTVLAGIVGGPAPAVGALVGTVVPTGWTAALAAGCAAAAALVSWPIAEAGLPAQLDLLPVWFAGAAVGVLAVRTCIMRPRSKGGDDHA